MRTQRAMLTRYKTNNVLKKKRQDARVSVALRGYLNRDALGLIDLKALGTMPVHFWAPVPVVARLDVFSKVLSEQVLQS